MSGLISKGLKKALKETRIEYKVPIRDLMHNPKGFTVNTMPYDGEAMAYCDVLVLNQEEGLAAFPIDSEFKRGFPGADVLFDFFMNWPAIVATKEIVVVDSFIATDDDIIRRNIFFSSPYIESWYDGCEQEPEYVRPREIVKEVNAFIRNTWIKTHPRKTPNVMPIYDRQTIMALISNDIIEGEYYSRRTALVLLKEFQVIKRLINTLDQLKS